MGDADFMRAAIAEAEAARLRGEVPVGAVVVRDEEIVGRGHNLRESTNDPLGHAELVAIREAARRTGHWRLLGCTLYVTLEPCAMCAGALVASRVERLVFGARDPKAGFVRSLGNLVEDPRLNHRMEVSEGVLGEECGKLLAGFFAGLRARR
ncbi:MAG: tRNA adenosine(34) deaminase TadA [Thermoanaerobaculia bacterium]